MKNIFNPMKKNISSEFTNPGVTGLNKASEPKNSIVEAKAKAREAKNTSLNTAKPVASQDKKKAVAGDPMGDARSKVQEEIAEEFVAIIATGTLRASEATTLSHQKSDGKAWEINFSHELELAKPSRRFVF